jgi:hypothetical protein
VNSQIKKTVFFAIEILKMTLVANLTCLISLFSNLENVEKYNLCEGGLCLCRDNFEPQCVTEEIIKAFCLPVSSQSNIYQIRV